MERISKAQIKLIRSLQQKKYRDETGLFIAEGEKCIEELRRSFELVMHIREGENATRTEIEQMSSLRTPQGVIGVFRKPSDSGHADKSNEHLTLALDAIQDPGNLGTIIRTCDWFGVHDIYCSPDTADCYSPKVVQATMGALARVRIHYVDMPQWLQSQRTEQKVKIYGTLLDGKDIYEVLSAQQQTGEAGPSIIVMGNEGNGISEAVRSLITHPVRIPSYPNKEASDVVESLNVAIATAIVLAEFRRAVC
jgi:TrmH family RNA methyltransferase